MTPPHNQRPIMVEPTRESVAVPKCCDQSDGDRISKDIHGTVINLARCKLVTDEQFENGDIEYCDEIRSLGKCPRNYQTLHKNSPITVEPWDGVKTIWGCGERHPLYIGNSLGYYYCGIRSKDSLIYNSCDRACIAGVCPKGYANPFGER
jgi:hypothetical protein